MKLKTNLTKGIACLLALVMMLGSMTSIGVTADVVALDGSGTQADPFLIGTADELMFATNMSNSTDETVNHTYSGNYAAGYRVCYKITADIDMSGYAFPGFGREDLASGIVNCGGHGRGFYGVVNGDGHVIKNLSISGAAGYPAGFLCKTFSSAVTDLGLENVTISAGTSTGAFIGIDRASSALQSCYVKEFTNNGDNANKKGALVGSTNVGAGSSSGVTFINCYSVNAGTQGIMGLNSGIATANAVNCYTTGTDQNNPTQMTNYYRNVSESQYADPVANKFVSGKLTADKLNAQFTSIDPGARQNGGFVADKLGINNGFPVLAWQNGESGDGSGDESGDGTGDDSDDDSDDEPDKIDMYFYGSGTEADPFLITNADELSALAELSNSDVEATKHKYAGLYPSSHVYYKLTSDINMEGRSFEGIGRNDLSTVRNCGGYGPGFMGVIDGDGHVISNLTIDGKGDYPVGLVGLALNSTFKNLGLENVVINGNGANAAGAFLGNDKGYGTRLENCFVKNVVFNKCGYNSAYGVGGLVGQCLGNISNALYSVTFDNCYSLNISGNEAAVSGGIMGVNVTGGISAAASNCYSDIVPFDTSKIAAGNVSVLSNIFAAGTDEFTAEDLGDGFEADAEINNGLPVLNWEKGRTADAKEYKKLTLETDGHGNFIWEKTFGSEELGAGEHEVEAGIYMKLRPNPDGGYQLDKITVNGEAVSLDNGVLRVNMAEDCTVSVSFKEFKVEGHAFYVALDGSDENDGSFNAPFRTIEKAKEVVNQYKKADIPDGTPITVYIRGGEYEVENTITFDENDSGTSKNRIVYSAYGDEKVSFVGGKILDTSMIEKVTDSELLDRLVEEDAKSKLMMLDLKAQGVTMDPVGTSSAIPMRIYMNNTALTDARWPNDDQSQNLVTCRPLTQEKDGISYDQYNAPYKPIKYEFPDAENRSAKWTVKKNDSYVGGAIVYFWASDILLIDNIDKEKKVVTTTTSSGYGPVKDVGWGPQYKIYFGNIFEEIDQPGESYVDREKGILYFYPVGSVSDAQMIVSRLKKDMITINNASYITFKGIDFKDSVKTPVVISNSDNIRIEDSDISNISEGAVTMTNCTNTVITGCNFANIGRYVINISGGDREGLVPSGNLIENNNFHAFSQMISNNGKAGIYLKGCMGEVIRHNEFSDFGYMALRLDNSNDILFEYNKLLHGVQMSTDAGAINWGEDISSLGITIRYNYFEDMGSELIGLKLHGGAAGSVFWDNAGTGPNLYGNVFLNGGIESAMISSNGGEFSNVHGNILIDTEGDRLNVNMLYIRPWSTYLWDNKIKYDKPINSYLFLNRFRDLYGQSMGVATTDVSRALMWSEEWAEHYKETQWKDAIEHYGKELYDGAKELYDAGNKEGLLNYLDENMKAGKTNHIHNNVVIGEFGKAKISEADNNVYNNYIGANTLTAAEKAMFVDFDNKNFALTDEGYQKIKQSAPEFERIDFAKIGLLTDVGGHKPSVTINPGIISGIPEVGNEITPSYTFTDADGDLEGTTKVYWYLSDRENGKFEKIWGKQGQHFELTDEYAGCYLKYEVIPYDVNVLRGEAVMSDAIEVRQGGSIDFSSLSSAMSTARDLLDNAVIGTGAGQYPEDAKTDLQKALDEAQAVVDNRDVTQYQVNKAAEALESAIQTFKSRENNITDTFDMTVERINISELLKDQDNWNKVAGGFEFADDGSLVIGNGVHSWVTYKGKTFKNTEFSFKYKAEAIEELNEQREWGGIYLRQNNDNSIIWNSGSNSGFMLDLHQYEMAFQHYPTPGKYDTLDTFLLELDKEYDMTVGLYDLNNEEEVVLIFTVDGETKYAGVLPYDALYGVGGFLGFNAGDNTKVTISAAEVDTDALDAKIAETESFLASVTVGDGYNQISADAETALTKVLDDAKAVSANAGSVQYDVDKVLVELNKALLDAKNAISDTGEISGNGSVEINPDIPEANITVDKDVKDLTIEVDASKETPAITVTADDVELTIEQGTVISGDFKAPLLSGASPSGSFTLGEAVNTYAQGGSAVSADKPVRIVLKGQKGMQVAYKDGAKYVNVAKTLREDSFDAAEDALTGGTKAVKMNIGDDLVIYTTLLSEFVTYERTVASDDDDYESNNNNNYGGAPAGGGGGAGGFFSTSTTTPSADATNTFVFSDMTSHWAKQDVMSMYNAGIVSGVTANLFEPDRPITRAEFATLIAKGLKLTLETTDDFADVASNDWFAPYVGAAAKAGIIVGSDGKFRPNDTITREEMAVIIVKAYNFKGGKGENGAIDNFSDKAQISDWAKPFVDSAASAGLIAGMGDGTFGPKANATRAQSASLVKRLLSK